MTGSVYAKINTLRLRENASDAQAVATIARAPDDGPMPAMRRTGAFVNLPGYIAEKGRIASSPPMDAPLFDDQYVACGLFGDLARNAAQKKFRYSVSPARSDHDQIRAR